MAYGVNAAEDGTAGQKKLQVCSSYHLLITGHNLPKLTGIELVRKLRAARMALPVVLATHRKVPYARIGPKCVASTFSHAGVKPLSLDTLLSTAKTVLRDRPSPRTDRSAGRLAIPPVRCC